MEGRKPQEERLKRGGDPSNQTLEEKLRIEGEGSDGWWRRNEEEKGQENGTSRRPSAPPSAPTRVPARVKRNVRQVTHVTVAVRVHLRRKRLLWPLRAIVSVPKRGSVLHVLLEVRTRASH